MDVGRLFEIQHGLLEEDQDLFKRNMGNHGGRDVSSMEEGLAEVGVPPTRVDDPAGTPLSQSFLDVEQ